MDNDEKVVQQAESNDDYARLLRLIERIYLTVAVLVVGAIVMAFTSWRSQRIGPSLSSYARVFKSHC